MSNLVDEIHRNGNSADGDTIKQLLHLDPGQDAEMVAARANMTTVVRMLHDPSSQMMDMVIAALREGRICIIDVSQMRGTPALVLSGLILQRIFDHNQEEFTKAVPATIPVIAVVEEAQSVLGSGGSSGEGPYVSWVKEGRKYDLGAMLITQQPGAITGEILSQGDNWFVFHLLSAGDLSAIKKANAHFSDDLLASLLNEPIPGHGIFWSSVSGKSYPIPIRVMSFEAQYVAHDPGYNKPAAGTAAEGLRGKFARALAKSRQDGQVALLASTEAQPAMAATPAPVPGSLEPRAEEPEDVLETYVKSAIARLRGDATALGRIRSKDGIPWMGVQSLLEAALPEVLNDRRDVAYNLVPRAMDEVFGHSAWRTDKRQKKAGDGTTTWIVLK